MYSFFIKLMTEVFTMFNTFTAETFTAPVEKLVSLNLSVFKKTVDAQTKSMNSLVELTDSRLKAMAGIKDAEGFKTFVTEQNEIAKDSFAKALNESKDAAAEVKAYNDEVMKIVTDSVEVNSKAKKAA